MKRAICIGINYTGTPYELQGCQNDAATVAKMLMKNGYEVTLIADHPRIKIKPTAANILEAFRTGASRTGPGDTLYIHYSGHGGYTKNYSGTEADGEDETICALDCDIVDDLLFGTLVAPLPRGANLIAAFDCCHSGSALDLPFRCQDNDTIIRENQNSCAANVVMLSGCRDDQTSADAYGLSAAASATYNPSEYCGALTWGMLAALKSRPKSGTWLNLLDSVRIKLANKKFSQIPQLSMSNAELLQSVVNI